MKIIPAMYLSGAVAVSRYKGDRGQATLLSRDPLRSAKEFEEQGAAAIHLVDLDGDGCGSAANRGLAHGIAAGTHLSVQYAEGVSSLETAETLLSGGIARISLNQFSQHLLVEALKRFGPEKILFTVRAQRNIVEGRGGLEVFHYGRDLTEAGVAHIIFRDTRAEGTFHPNFDEVERLRLGCPAKIYAFGGIGTLDDLAILQRAGAEGAIISRAFFEKRLSLRQCLRQFTPERDFFCS